MQLTIELQGQIIQTLALSADTLTIGRLPDNGVALANPLVSRRHAELRLTPAGPTLTDLESTSGTFIRGELLLPNQPRLLADGDEIRIGPFALIYRAEATADRPTTSDQRPATNDDAPENGVNGSDGSERQASENQEPKADKVEEAPSEGDGSERGAAEQRTGESGKAEHPTPERRPLERQATNGLAQLAMLNAQFLDLQTQLPNPLARFPARLANGTGSRYLLDLPVIFHDSDFLGRYLEIFETIWEALEQRQDYIHMYFDPRTAPEPMLAWLASWIDVSLNQHWPEPRRRELLKEATELYRWRGTRYGLTRMIEVCTGLTPQIENIEPFVFRVRVAVPPDSTVAPAFIEELVRAHKPAHAGYVLEVQR